METVEYRVVKKYGEWLFQRRQLLLRATYQEHREICSNISKTVCTGSETFWGEWEDCQPEFVPPNAKLTGAAPRNSKPE